jgi:hypothetical protein
MTTPPTYPAGRWTGTDPRCRGCGAEPLPIGGPEGGATLHREDCTRRPGEPVAKNSRPFRVTAV